MRVSHEIGPMKNSPNPRLSSLVPQNSQIVKRDLFISPETRNYRYQQEWQQQVVYPNPTENNNLEDYNFGFGFNGNETILASSPTHENCNDRQNSIMDSDSSDSSSEDEDSSLCFSDTNPLLDVSSLDDVSSDVNSDAEMSDNDCIPEIPADEADEIDYGNNNGDDGAVVEEDPSMETSWMSYSSAESQKLSVTQEVKRKGTPTRNGVVLPDVLPLEEPINDIIEPEVKVKKRGVKMDAAHRVARECCIVEITTQPDIQVDIRLNTASTRPFAGASIKHGNTYPRDSSKNYNFYFKTNDVGTPPAVLNSYNTARDPGVHPCFALGEGIRLNNFTIVNSFKALNLTEIFGGNDVVSQDSNNHREKFKLNHLAIEIPKANSGSVDKCVGKIVTEASNDIHNEEEHNERYHSDCSANEQRLCTIAAAEKKTKVAYPSRSMRSLDESPPVPQHRVTRKAVTGWNNDESFKKGSGSQLPAKESTNLGKTTSPELFEVFTNETALANTWSSAPRSSKESEWIKKRRNDREEIRRKLAMDSDTEDYITEKAIPYHSSGLPSVGGLKRGGNLQICFMNEAAKDCEDTEKPVSSSKEQSHDPEQMSQQRMMKKNSLFPPSLPKHTMQSSKHQNNNNFSSHPEVIKRQRPTFFFNRPRSWHAPKIETRIEMEEDIVTRHRRLQTEAREALTQAKAMARMQMEIERQKKKKSPIAEIVGITFPDGRNFWSGPAMMDMNVAQLQVIVNDLHSQIQTLNEDLVKFLLTRDDLHMEQDSMLVDIEDLTRYLGLKENASSMVHLPDVKTPSNLKENPFSKKLMMMSELSKTVKNIYSK